MRIVFIVILVVLLAWSIIDPIRRLNQKPSYFWVGFLSIVIIILSIMEVRWLTYEKQMYDITYSVANQETEFKKTNLDGKEKPSFTLHCQRFSEAFFDPQVSRKGEAPIGQGQALISYDTCQDFIKFNETPYEERTDEQIATVAVAIHEGYHLNGVQSEAVTECLTRKYYSDALVKLNVPKKFVEDYSKRYVSYSTKFLPEKYQNGEC